MAKKISNVILNDMAEIASELKSYYPKLSGKTILIAGGAGFLGRYLVSALDYLNEKNLLEKPCKIIIVDNFITGLKGWIEEKPGIKLMQQDISKHFSVDGPVDYIINAASIASPVFYNKFRIETIDAGFLGTKNLLELAREKNVKSFLFTSSSEVYGDPVPEMIPTPEHYLGNVSCNGPRACYDEPKRIGETLCVNYADIYKIPVKIARPFNVFGPGIRLDDGRVVPAFVVAAIQGKKMPVYGGGTRTRTFCYISNATIGLFQILLSEKVKEVYNIGADDPEITIKHLADTINGLVAHKDSEVHMAEEPSKIYEKHTDPNRRCPDLTKIRMELGYNPKINLITGLKRFISWVREELENGVSGELEDSCRICGNSQMKMFLSLGVNPLANNFISPEDLPAGEEKYPLDVMYCEKCHNCQLSYIVNRDKLFKNYYYVSSTTQTLRKHFSEMAESMRKQFNLSGSSLVVDIGSNDGFLLKELKNYSVNVIGVEPAENIVEIARKTGIDTIHDYFNEEVAESIVKLKGKSDVITANNVFAHTKDIVALTDNVKKLMKEDGVFIIEVQHLLRTIEDLTFDNIYHEHIHYFSLLALSEFFSRQGMKIFKVEEINTHGGSIRVYVQKDNGPRKIDASVYSLLSKERAAGLDKFETYKKFGDKVYEMKENIIYLIGRNRPNGKKIIGYGAPAKASTLLNFCQLTNEEIEFVVDDNPLKQGRLIPGTKIPIKSRDALESLNPSSIIILAWNLADEIIKNNKDSKLKDTKFIIPLPVPRVI